MGDREVWMCPVHTQEEKRRGEKQEQEGNREKRRYGQEMLGQDSTFRCQTLCRGVGKSPCERNKILNNVENYINENICISRQQLSAS